MWTVLASVAYNALMLRRPSTLLVAIALCLPLGTGCNKKPQLTEVEVPEAGVSLRYDLTPGQEYGGHVKMRNSAQTPMGDVVSTLEFDVAMTVSANKDGEHTLVRATVQGIEFSMRLPDGIPPAMVGGMNAEMAKGLNGIEVSFKLNERGEVDDLPEPPEGGDPGVRNLIGMITQALSAGLSVRTPEQPVKDGESWDAKSKDPDEAIKSATSTGTLQGLGRNEAGEDIAQLVYSADIESEREQGGAKFTIKMKVETEVAFSATGGYPVTVTRKINNELVGQASSLMEIEAEWSKGEKQAVEAAPATEVQAVTDPCDPDYAGMGECADDALPEEAPAEGAPAAEEAPAAEASK